MLYRYRYRYRLDAVLTLSLVDWSWCEGCLAPLVSMVCILYYLMYLRNDIPLCILLLFLEFICMDQQRTH